MSDNIYLETLNKSKLRKDIKISLSPKREIVLNQKNKCYLCDRNLNSTMCHFANIFGLEKNENKKSENPSNELRALCPQCFFHLGKNPTK